MNEHQKASPSNPKISQLYQQFKVLKDYLNSNKKIKSHLQSTPSRNYPPQPHPTTPTLLATPQTKKPSKPGNLTTNSKNNSGLGKMSSNNKSQKQSHKSYSNRQELIDEYYKHYEHSIRKVLKYKEKSAKRQAKENVEREEGEGGLVGGKREQGDVRKKLDFEGKANQEDTSKNEIHCDFTTVQLNFENSLNLMITNFETNLSAKFSNEQKRLDKISLSIQKVKTLIQSKSQSQQNASNPHRQHSVQIDEFNELMSQKDNQSVCSETFDNPIQDI